MKYISYVVIINVSCTSYKMFRSQRSCWIETKWNVKTWKSFCQRRWHPSATWVCRYTHCHSCLLIEACCFCWGHTNAENSPANTKDKNSDPCEGQTTSGKNKTHNNKKTKNKSNILSSASWSVYQPKQVYIWTPTMLLFSFLLCNSLPTNQNRSGRWLF